MNRLRQNENAVDRNAVSVGDRVLVDDNHEHRAGQTGIVVEIDDNDPNDLSVGVKFPDGGVVWWYRASRVRVVARAAKESAA